MSTNSLGERLLERIRGKRNKFRTLFGSPLGKEVLKEILEDGGIAKVSFTNDASLTAFNEGKRYLALKILGLAVEDVEGAIQKLKETKYE